MLSRTPQESSKSREITKQEFPIWGLYSLKTYASSPVNSKSERHTLFGAASRLALTVPVTCLVRLAPPTCPARATSPRISLHCGGFSSLPIHALTDCTSPSLLIIALEGLVILVELIHELNFGGQDRVRHVLAQLEPCPVMMSSDAKAAQGSSKKQPRQSSTSRGRQGSLSGGQSPLCPSKGAAPFNRRTRGSKRGAGLV
jgi:hypothetical protein